MIEDRLGTAVSCFAYPYGRYDERRRALARQLFACACSDALGLVGARSDPWALERIDTHSAHRPALRRRAHPLAPALRASAERPALTATTRGERARTTLISSQNTLPPEALTKDASPPSHG
jgi:hypothetical protein